jgi:hypothetical protein
VPPPAFRLLKLLRRLLHNVHRSVAYTIVHSQPPPSRSLSTRIQIEKISASAAILAFDECQRRTIQHRSGRIRGLCHYKGSFFVKRSRNSARNAPDAGSRRRPKHCTVCTSGLGVHRNIKFDAMVLELNCGAFGKIVHTAEAAPLIESVPLSLAFTPFSLHVLHIFSKLHQTIRYGLVARICRSHQSRSLSAPARPGFDSRCRKPSFCIVLGLFSYQSSIHGVGFFSCLFASF